MLFYYSKNPEARREPHIELVIQVADSQPAPDFYL